MHFTHFSPNNGSILVKFQRKDLTYKILVKSFDPKIGSTGGNGWVHAGSTARYITLSPTETLHHLDIARTSRINGCHFTISISIQNLSACKICHNYYLFLFLCLCYSEGISAQFVIIGSTMNILIFIHLID